MKSYAVTGLLSALLFITAVALFNYWVDPNCIYRFQSADVARMSRVNQGYTMRMSKPWQVTQLGPEAAVIGSSRTAPIRPRHSSWEGIRTFNLSMPGITLYEMKHTIRHAHKQRMTAEIRPSLPRGWLWPLVIGLLLGALLALVLA